MNSSSLRCGQEHDRLISLTLRALQLATCTVALALVSSSFQAQTLSLQSSSGASRQITVYYGGPAVNFVLIVSFAACIYDAFLLLLVFMLRCAKMPAPWSFGVDAVFTMLFMSAGCALAASDYMRYCDDLDGVVNCTLLMSGAALCFMAFVCFLLSVAWGAWMRNTWVKPRSKDPLGHSMGLSSDPVLGDLDELERATTYASSTYVQDGFSRS